MDDEQLQILLKQAEAGRNLVAYIQRLCDNADKKIYVDDVEMGLRAYERESRGYLRTANEVGRLAATARADGGKG